MIFFDDVSYSYHLKYDIRNNRSKYTYKGKKKIQLKNQVMRQEKIIKNLKGVNLHLPSLVLAAKCTRYNQYFHSFYKCPINHTAFFIDDK